MNRKTFVEYSKEIVGNIEVTKAMFKHSYVGVNIPYKKNVFICGSNEFIRKGGKN